MESSVKLDLEKPIGVVCHDAGGANQILAMLREYGLQGVSAYMEGPAAGLWRIVFPCTEMAKGLAEVIDGTMTLITGTGWASHLEHKARRLARERGARSIAVLDHWTNYQERFVRDGQTVLPDEIWVVDEYAQAIASRAFPSLTITLQPDHYSEQQSRKILPLEAASRNELLYLLEPARSSWGRAEPGEFQALRYFFEHLPQLGLPAGVSIRLRPHPSDPPGKYDTVLKTVGSLCVLLDTDDLAESLSRARWVAGCETYALTLALKAGRTVYCTLPPWAPACSLPHLGLVHLKDVCLG